MVGTIAFEVTALPRELLALNRPLTAKEKEIERKKIAKDRAKRTNDLRDKLDALIRKYRSSIVRKLQQGNFHSSTKDLVDTLKTLTPDNFDAFTKAVQAFRQQQQRIVPSKPPQQPPVLPIDFVEVAQFELAAQRIRKKIESITKEARRQIKALDQAQKKGITVEIEHVFDTNIPLADRDPAHPEKGRIPDFITELAFHPPKRVSFEGGHGSLSSYLSIKTRPLQRFEVTASILVKFLKYELFIVELAGKARCTSPIGVEGFSFHLKNYFREKDGSFFFEPSLDIRNASGLEVVDFITACAIDVPEINTVATALGIVLNNLASAPLALVSASIGYVVGGPIGWVVGALVGSIVATVSNYFVAKKVVSGIVTGLVIDELEIRKDSIQQEIVDFIEKDAGFIIKPFQRLISLQSLDSVKDNEQPLPPRFQVFTPFGQRLTKALNITHLPERPSQLLFGANALSLGNRLNGQLSLGSSQQQLHKSLTAHVKRAELRETERSQNLVKHLDEKQKLEKDELFTPYFYVGSIGATTSYLTELMAAYALEGRYSYKFSSEQNDELSKTLLALLRPLSNDGSLNGDDRAFLYDAKDNPRKFQFSLTPGSLPRIEPVHSFDKSSTKGNAAKRFRTIFDDWRLSMHLLKGDARSGQCLEFSFSSQLWTEVVLGTLRSSRDYTNYALLHQQPRLIPGLSKRLFDFFFDEDLLPFDEGAFPDLKRKAKRKANGQLDLPTDFHPKIQVSTSPAHMIRSKGFSTKTSTKLFREIVNHRTQAKVLQQLQELFYHAVVLYVEHDRHDNSSIISTSFLRGVISDDDRRDKTAQILNGGMLNLKTETLIDKETRDGEKHRHYFRFIGKPQDKGSNPPKASLPSWYTNNQNPEIRHQKYQITPLMSLPYLESDFLLEQDRCIWNLYLAIPVQLRSHFLPELMFQRSVHQGSQPFEVPSSLVPTFGLKPINQFRPPRLLEECQSLLRKKKP